MNIKEAKCIAFGSAKEASIEKYWEAWQWLYDNDVELDEADTAFLDKLICDGHVEPKPGYFD